MNREARWSTIIGFVALLGILFAGCSRTDQAVWPLAAPSTNALNEIIEAPIRSLGEERATVTAELGSPSSVLVAEVANRHEPGRVDKIHTINYAGIAVQIYEVVVQKKEILLSVRMTANHPGLLPELVGKDESEAKAILGTPLQVRAQDWDFKTTYESELGEDVLTLKFEDGRVAIAEWSFYID